MKQKYLFILLIFFVFCSLKAKAQQEPMYSQYMFNMLTLNPAYAGSHEVLESTVLFRRQWLGIPGAPSTGSLTLDIPDNNHKLAYGLQLVNDAIGVTKSNLLAGSISYRTNLTSEDDVLSVGLLASVTNFRADYNSIDLIQAVDPSFNGQVINAWLPNIGAGIYYHNENFYAGFSIPSILSNQVAGNTVSVGASVASNVLISHYFLTMGAVFPFGNDMKLKPSFLLKAVPGAPIQTDLNVNLWVHDRLSFGVSYRTNTAFIGMVELQITPALKFGYAYDHQTNSYAKFTSGSHEAMLKYEFSLSSVADRIFHTRYF